MDNSQNNQEIATILLHEIYKDYKKGKRYQFFFKTLYFILIFFGMIYFFSKMKEEKAPDPLKDQEYVAKIVIEGNIGGDNELGSITAQTIALIDQAQNTPQVVGILLEVDSPGGYPYDGFEIYRKVKVFKSVHPNKKVITEAKSLAASAAYMIACASDKIYASPMSYIGSIGVYGGFLSFEDFLKEHKINAYFYRSGAHKGSGNPFRNPTPEEKQESQRQVELIHKFFVDLVKENRKDRLLIDEKTFSGLAWYGQEALERGIIDHLDDTATLINREFGNYPIFELKNELNLLQQIKFIFRQLKTFTMTPFSLKDELYDTTRASL